MVRFSLLLPKITELYCKQEMHPFKLKQLYYPNKGMISTTVLTV